MVKTVEFTDFTRNISKLRSSSTRTQPHEHTLAHNEIIDDEVTFGGEDDGWEREERDGIMYMTRRE